jgi:hypothetical protein
MFLDDFGKRVILESILPDPFCFHQFNFRVLGKRWKEFIMWIRQKRVLLSVFFSHMIRKFTIVYRKIFIIDPDQAQKL